jgi:glycosyltransferase involved in cell wall biosynthesis
MVAHSLRLWDRQAGLRPDKMVAISETVRRRIMHYYGRESEVVYPGLLTGEEEVGKLDEGYYLAVGRLLPFKRFDLLVDTFRKLRKPLVIVGSGSLERRLRRKEGPYLRLVTDADDRALNDWYRRCKALVLPNEEDFGLTPVEAMARGKPVIALRAGGATETVAEDISGVFFDDPIPEALADAVIRLERGSFDAEAIAASVRRYGAALFDERMREIVEAC